MTGFSCKFLRRYLFSIQIIPNAYRYRKLLCAGSLIINVIFLCIPGNIVSILCKRLITFYVLNIFQVGKIFYLSFTAGIFQPVRYYDFLYTSV